MPIYLNLVASLFCAVLSLPGMEREAHAFDPFTLAAAGGAAINAVQAIGGASSEAAEIASSLSILSDLGAEFDSSAAADSQQGSRVSERIQEIESLALEAGYTQDELNDVLKDEKDSSRSLSISLSKITRSVRLAKRLAALAGISTKKASEVSQLEQTAALNNEQRILADIYGHMVLSDLDKKREELKKQKRIQEEVGKLSLFSRALAPGGNLRLFPTQQSIVKKAIEVFQSYAKVMLVLVSVIFVGRIIFFEFSFAPAEKYGELIKDAFLCFFLMLVFPTVYSYLAEYSDMLAVKLSQLLHVTGSTLPEPKKVFGLVLPWWFQPAVIQAVIYLLVYSIFNLVLAVLIAVGPIVILAGTMLNFSISLPTYFSALILIWLWPVVWNIIGYFASFLWQGKDWSVSGIAETAASLVFWVFQLLSPLVLFKHLQKSQAGQAFQGAVRGVGAARGTMDAGSWRRGSAPRSDEGLHRKARFSS